MAKRIIVLEKRDLGGGLTLNAVFWLTVPASRQTFYARVGATSKWIGASVGENASLASGAIAERAESYVVPPGATLAQIRNALEAIWTKFQADVEAYNIWDRYGSFWDDSDTWTAAGAS